MIRECWQESSSPSPYRCIKVSLMSTTKRRNTMFRISFGQRLVMIIAYVLLPVVSQPLTTLPKTAPLRPTATAPPRPSATAPPQPREAPPIPPPVPVLRVWPDHPSPGQTIKVDGEGRWPTGEMITVSLVISNEENEVVSSDTVHVGDNGTFTAFVTVPKDV